jgi:signal transduction histidine kinase
MLFDSFFIRLSWSLLHFRVSDNHFVTRNSTTEAKTAATHDWLWNRGQIRDGDGSSQYVSNLPTRGPNRPRPTLLKPAANERRFDIRLRNLNVSEYRFVNCPAVTRTSHTLSSRIAFMMQTTTRHQKIEESLVRLNRLSSLGLLSAGAAHEIKNALVAGKAFIDLLLEKHQDSDLAEIVRRELSRIDAIVSQILHYSSPVQKPAGPVDVHEVLDHALRLIQPQLDGKEIVLRQELRADQRTVNGDEFQLQQAFVNLLLNGLQAIGSMGTLTVDTRSIAAHQSRSEPSIQVTVSDTGMGIPLENQARLFEPFFTTKAKGTGLGLAITQQIIQDHAGTIRVESQPGSGARFVILLPLLS